MTFGKLRAIEAAAGGGSPKAAESAEAPAQDVPEQEVPVKAQAPEVSLLPEVCPDELGIALTNPMRRAHLCIGGQLPDTGDCCMTGGGSGSGFDPTAEPGRAQGARHARARKAPRCPGPGQPGHHRGLHSSGGVPWQEHAAQNLSDPALNANICALGSAIEYRSSA